MLRGLLYISLTIRVSDDMEMVRIQVKAITALIMKITNIWYPNKIMHRAKTLQTSIYKYTE